MYYHLVSHIYSVIWTLQSNVCVAVENIDRTRVTVAACPGVSIPFYKWTCPLVGKLNANYIFPEIAHFTNKDKQKTWEMVIIYQRFTLNSGIQTPLYVCVRACTAYTAHTQYEQQQHCTMQ